jgi:hypothetical protein
VLTIILQERNQHRMANSIRSAHALSSQASVYIPLVTQPEHMPSYISLEYNSKWHTSALQAAALETISLPSRLRSTTDNRSLLADMEQLFTATSVHRKILQAEMSVQNEVLQTNGIVNGIANAVSHERDGDLVMEDTDPNARDANAALDISLFPSMSQSPRASRTHLFSRLNILRGDASGPSLTVTGHEDPSGPLVHSYNTNLAFPVLSSYPSIFGSRHASLAMKASLSSNSNISTWLRALADNSIVLGWDEREEISSELRTWADEYIEGWESGSDDDWDD